MCGVSVDFVSLAFRTSPYVVCHLPLEPWPPIGSFNQLYGSRYTRVTIHLQIMMGLYDGSCSFSYVGDYSSGILVPCSINLFEFVWVNPSFEDSFILIFVISVDGHDGTYKQHIW